MIKQVPKEHYHIDKSNFFELKSSYRLLGRWIPHSTFPKKYSNEYYDWILRYLADEGIISEEREQEILKTDQLTKKEFNLFLDQWIQLVSDDCEHDSHRNFFICTTKNTADGSEVYPLISEWGWGFHDEFDRNVEGVFYSIDDAESYVETNGIRVF